MKAAHVTLEQREGIDACTALKCNHCMLVYLPALPMPLAQFAEQANGFALMHKSCAKPVEPSRQLPLPHHSYEQVKREIEAQEIAADGGNGSVCSMHDYEPQGIDGTTDDPAPQIDPPGPDLFRERYPMAADHQTLRSDLAVVLQGVLVPTLEQLQKHHPRSGVFDAIAHWTRVELAHMNAGNDDLHRPELAKFRPGRMPKPKALDDMRVELEKGTRKTKRGARPFSSPSKDAPATPPAKKTRKRRGANAK